MVKKRMIAAVLCAAFVLALCPAISRSVHGATSSEIAGQIDELKKQEQGILDELKELEGKLNANATAVSDTVGQKNVLDQQINLLHDQINNTNQQISAYRVMIADKQEELDVAEANHSMMQEKHKERIRIMEERGTLSYWSILFHANSFSDLLDRMNMIQEIAAADKRHLEDLRNAAAVVKAVKRELENQQGALEASKTELEEAKASLDEKRAEADALLQDLVKQGEEYEQMLAESEEKQDQLMEDLAKKESEYDAALYAEWLATSVASTESSEDEPPPPPNAEGWVTPVPYYTLTSPFGMRFHPILNVWRMHSGVDMACAANTPIYATRDGMVVTTDYQENGAGYYVQLDHGDGYRSIYMHMTRYIVAPGDFVTAGQVIGYVGSTGLSEGNHLHFGISYNGTYVNPMQFVS